ncbi:MAG: N-acetyltransferase [Ruminococcaceae bacterium]|nr:N-acetyltransferase [Oscillospiraceae bacterium]
MHPYDIRPATLADLEILDQIFEGARAYMRKEGNTVQWQTGPFKSDIERDIKTGLLMVLANKKDMPDAGEIEGVFFAQVFPEPTYLKIDGAWIDDEKPYITIHRLASRGRKPGVSDAAIDWCKERSGSVRIDTHETNLSMIRAIRRNGFTYCGIIIIADKTPRLAYQWVKED